MLLQKFTRLNFCYFINKFDFIKLYLKAWDIDMTTSNIQKFWAKSDLFFLNFTAVLKKLFKSRSNTLIEKIILNNFTEYLIIVSYTSVNAKKINEFITRMTEQKT